MKRIQGVGRFYVLAFLIAWAFWWPMALNKLGVFEFGIPLIIGQSIGAYAPLLSLVVLDKLFKRKGLLKSVFAQLKIKKQYLAWYILAALLPLALAILSTSLRYLSGELEQPALLRPEPVEELGLSLIVIIPVQFLASLFSSPLGEEPGWRGFVYKELYPRIGKHVASVVVGTFWWLWHIPLFLLLGEQLSAMSFLGLLGHSFIIDALFVLSGHNLLVAMLYHQGINTALIFFNSGNHTLTGVLLLWAVAIFIRILWATGYGRN